MTFMRPAPVCGVRLQLKDGVTALKGMNGAGTTTILETIATGCTGLLRGNEWLHVHQGEGQGVPRHLQQRSSRVRDSVG